MKPTPRPLYPPGKRTSNHSAGDRTVSSGPVWTGAENLPHTPHRAAHSESPYRPRYPAAKFRNLALSALAGQKISKRLLRWCRLVVVNRRFETTYRIHLQGVKLAADPCKMALMCCPVTSIISISQHTRAPCNVPG